MAYQAPMMIFHMGYFKQFPIVENYSNADTRFFKYWYYNITDTDRKNTLYVQQLCNIKIMEHIDIHMQKTHRFTVSIYKNRTPTLRRSLNYWNKTFRVVLIVNCYFCNILRLCCTSKNVYFTQLKILQSNFISAISTK